MREEEKLARDVYLTLGTMYPNSAIFGNIDDSEQKHTMAVKAMIDINQCPEVIVATDNGIDDITQCGSIYTKNRGLNRMCNNII